MRPRTLDEVAGHAELLGPKGFLRRAIAEGRSAAHGVDTYLQGTPSILPRPINPTDRPLVV